MYLDIDNKKIFGIPRYVKFMLGITGLIAGYILIRTLILMPFIVEDSSMEPSLNKGNYILILKITEPHDGDIVLVQSPVQKDKVVLKRLIARGEKTIEIIDKRILINNAEYRSPYSVSKDSQIFPGSFTNRDNMKSTIIGRDEVFLLGDNYDRSFDSREFGPVNKELIIGRMIYKF